MNRSKWHNCPSCGLPNIIERKTCKRCRAIIEPASLPGAPTIALGRPAARVPAPPQRWSYSDDTGRLYISVDSRHRLLLFPQRFEYAGPETQIQCEWKDVTGVRPVRGVDYLWIKDDEQRRVIISQSSSETWRLLTIPLTYFGYPSNAQLLADLHRYAPQLRRRRW